MKYTILTDPATVDASKVLLVTENVAAPSSLLLLLHCALMSGEICDMMRLR